jgi:predicted RNA-binding Zn-ribbon protein involved in translation (DUF1610 family)
VEPEACLQCKGKLEPWSGKVWFEPRPDVVIGEEDEHLEGPCPRCGTTITLADKNGVLGPWA